jgi:hypothetical protein
MIKKLFPQHIDNTYRGHKLALWSFGLVATMKMFQGLMIIFNGPSVVVSAWGIPLDTFSPVATQTVLALYGLSGLSLLIMSFLCWVVLMRYRGAVPFMFACYRSVIWPDS